jgi:ubiquinone/menaquinone biosynthesis C-methylase UbiE
MTNPFTPGPLVEISYDEKISSVYDEAQPISHETLGLWMERFKYHAGDKRPQAVLDLGCGTGQFAPALADTFGGPVFAVEPSAHMRAIAERLRPHPKVSYYDGSAERILLPDETCDLVLMFQVLQHIADREAAAMEIARVLRPGGHLLVKSRFVGEPTPRAWARYFPRAYDIEERSLLSVGETVEMFAPAGLEFISLDRFQTNLCESFRSYLDRIRLRAISSFRDLTEEEFAAGIASMEADAAQEITPHAVFEDSDLMTFAYP